MVPYASLRPPLTSTFGSKEGELNFIRKHWITVSIASLVLGVFIKLNFGSYVLAPQIITEVINGNAISKTHYIPNIEYPIADLISNLLFTLSIALLISLAFLRAIEATDKEKFENKLLQFQKDTAEDAIASTFERVIDDDFFQIIKTDVLNAKFQRHKLRWYYDIDRNDTCNTMTLTRTISYLLKNISPTEQAENIYLATFSTAHCSTETVAIKYKMEGESSFKDLVLDNKVENGTLTNTNKEVVVPGLKAAEIVTSIRQTFPRDYIYETHFLNQGGVSLELTVNLPKDFQFSVNPTVLADRTEKLVDESTKKVYRINGAIYRGQGIEFMCFRESKTEQSAQEGTPPASAAS